MTSEIKNYIDKSVLCWLATSSYDNYPNVSPKEVFTYFNDTYIIVANIASPQTVKNIVSNPKVCISFIDVLVQKGFQIKGTAEIISNSDSRFSVMESSLLELTEGKYPFSTITAIEVESSKPIIAPSYLLYPETKEEDQIVAAKKAYNLD